MKHGLRIIGRWVIGALLCASALTALGCEGLMLNQAPIGELPTPQDAEEGTATPSRDHTPDCVPACDGFSTGPDGCGGTCCVASNETRSVDEVALNCVAYCLDRVCGDDGCGGTCGRCQEGLTCEAGACGCAPQFAQVCCNDGAQACYIDGCGNLGKVAEDCPDGCHNDACCTPDCRDATCGDDGCGGTCGTCTDSETCIDASCGCPPAEAVVCCEDNTALCSYDGCGHLEGVQESCTTGCADDACCDHCEEGHLCQADGSCVCGDLGVACAEGFACEGGHCVGDDGGEVYVPAGEFVMGCTSAEGEACASRLDELPRRMILVEGFAIDRREVSAFDYQTCVTTSGCGLPLMTSDNGASYTAPAKYTHPINFVTWANAEDYCDRQEKRLCSEAEWEMAGRGSCDSACPSGDFECCEAMMSIFPWGNAAPNCDRANHGSTACVGDTTPVGSYPEGVSRYGVHDLSGNVWEWVQDCWHADYEGAPTSGQAWVEPYGICESKHRVIRGGSYNYGGESIRLAERLDNNPKFGSASIGFRCCRDIDD